MRESIDRMIERLRMNGATNPHRIFMGPTCRWTVEWTFEGGDYVSIEVFEDGVGHMTAKLGNGYRLVGVKW